MQRGDDFARVEIEGSLSCRGNIPYELVPHESTIIDPYGWLSLLTYRTDAQQGRLKYIYQVYIHLHIQKIHCWRCAPHQRFTVA